MVERVIFAFRVKQLEEGVQYEFDHPIQGISARVVAPERFCFPVTSCRPTRYSMRKATKIKANVRREMGRRMEFYSRIYEELYKDE